MEVSYPDTVGICRGMREKGAILMQLNLRCSHKTALGIKVYVIAPKNRDDPPSEAQVT